MAFDDFDFFGGGNFADSGGGFLTGSFDPGGLTDFAPTVEAGFSPAVGAGPSGFEPFTFPSVAEPAAAASGGPPGSPGVTINVGGRTADPSLLQTILGTISSLGTLGVTGLGAFRQVQAIKDAKDQERLERDRAKAQADFLANAKNALAGLTGEGGAIEGASQGIQQLQPQAAELAGVASSGAGHLIPAGVSGLLGGQLPPDLESMVTRYRQRLVADATDLAARAGYADSTQFKEQILPSIEESVAGYRQQLIGSLVGRGTQLGTLATRALGTSAGLFADIPSLLESGAFPLAELGLSPDRLAGLLQEIGQTQAALTGAFG